MLCLSRPTDGIGHTCYPLDDPPPYPGDGLHSVDEKQPLNPSHLYVAMETPDEVLLSAGRREHAHYNDVSGSASLTNEASAQGDDDEALSGVSHSASAATALVSNSSEETVEEVGVEGGGRERRRSHPQRTHQLLLTALSRSSSDSGRRRAYSDKDRAAPPLTQHTCRPSKSPKSSKASSSSSFSPSKSIELGAFLRTLSERRGHDEGDADDGEPQQTTKLLSDDAQDNPLEQETPDDVSDGVIDVTDQEEEEQEEEEDGTPSVTSQTATDSLSLDDCTVQVIPQG